MTTPNDGGPAFPHREYDSRPFHHGMSLRDYFACQALVLFSGNPEAAFGDNPEALVAKAAYNMADAMLAERAKGAK